MTGMDNDLYSTHGKTLMKEKQPLTRKQLLTLRIHEKNFHASKLPEQEAIFLNALKASLSDTFIEKKEFFAPPLFDGQPRIPYTLLKPEQATKSSKKPLIIHTHGGPHVYFGKNTPHAEIAWFLSHGYVVACPNYRGSTGYPKISIEDEAGFWEQVSWEQWEKEAAGKYHIYGPEDVYTVAVHMQSMDYVDSSHTFLRGGSVGSMINAHLLAGIQQGKFESIFTGVHLCGGMNYPLPTNLPDDIPLLISHGVEDDVASYEDAEMFMQKCLIKQLAAEMDDKKLWGIQTFVAELGDHHMIDPDLQLGDTSSLGYQELKKYLRVATNFIHKLSTQNLFKRKDHYLQFESLSPITNEPAETRILQQIYCYQEMQTIPITIMPVEPPKMLESGKFHGPTMALLKIKLGKHFTGNIVQDFEYYLGKQFAPMHLSSEKFIHNAGQRLLADDACMRQLFSMIAQEEYFLKKNPDHMVAYHATDQHTLQLYCFIDLWLKMLQGIIPDNLTVIHEMRLYDFIKNSFHNIEIFLQKMMPCKNQTDIFNNLPGFPERALSCNPSLVSNTFTSASCSLWWFFEPMNSIASKTTQSIIKQFFEMLGLDSAASLNRYLDLFERHYTEHNSQTLMQQFFIPYAIAKKRAYLCQIWGEPFNSNTCDLQNPETIRKLINDPIGFELNIQQVAKRAFTNFGANASFGDTEAGFRYSDLFQLRYIPGEPVPTYSWFKNPALHQQFIQELSQLIREDFVDYLAHGCKIPKTMILQGEDFRKKLYATSQDLHFFNRNKCVNVNTYYQQQLELRMDLVENPSRKQYGKIQRLPKHEKKQIQDKLALTLFGSVYRSKAAVSTFALCKKLHGYTYYDVLTITASYTFLENPCLPHGKDDYQFFMQMVDKYAAPDSIEAYPLKEVDYLRLVSLVEQIKSATQSAPEPGHKTNFIPWCVDRGRKDLENAFDSFMRHAVAANDKALGKPVDYQAIYCGVEKSMHG